MKPTLVRKLDSGIAAALVVLVLAAGTAAWSASRAQRAYHVFHDDREVVAPGGSTGAERPRADGQLREGSRASRAAAVASATAALATLVALGLTALRIRASHAEMLALTARTHAAEERAAKLDRELALRTQQLEAADRELESFCFSVSHDLRAPLRHIDGFAGLLAKHSATTLDSEALRFLGVITRSASHLCALIDDLLDYSRVGRAPLRIGPVQHAPLVAGLVAEGSFRANGRAPTWHIEPLPDLLADEAMLRRIWLNLLDNAVKFSSKAANPVIAIGGRSDSAAGEYVFSVRDNGVGFDMAYADRLFGVFQRLHGPAEFEGTGIGLAIVRRLVVRHGGRTWAEGRAGEGATFYFSIPFKDSPPTASH